jgi:hypothetical protein
MCGPTRSSLEIRLAAGKDVEEAELGNYGCGLVTLAFRGRALAVIWTGRWVGVPLKSGRIRPRRTA